MTDNTNNDFNRILNTWDVIMVTFGAMIGWGWVVAKCWICSSIVIKWSEMRFFKFVEMEIL
ncbi:hypothetical protein FNW54_04670 [Bacteroides sp. HF-5092]|uniref:hypothetical protein n=1 Tax=Bacteroides TaxID=816 RepID=UPI00117754A2|nr:MULTISPECIES: hypothetical protein [Bacteroides]TRX46747.1 hypothetical protein FNW54_04670 [Bacteroides sp. HF-5092]